MTPFERANKFAQERGGPVLALRDIELDHLCGTRTLSWIGPGEDPVAILTALNTLAINQLSNITEEMVGMLRP